MSEKRKRKSFWEPEQEHIQQWIANQKDLGRSIQLLAADAIQKYGQGDAIEAMVNMQTGGGPTQTPAPVAPEVAPTPVVTPTPVVETPAPAAPQPVVETPQPAPSVTPAAPTTPPAAPPSQSLGEDALANLFANQVR